MTTDDIALASIRAEIEQLYEARGSSNGFTAEASARYHRLLDVEERLLGSCPLPVR